MTNTDINTLSNTLSNTGSNISSLYSGYPNGYDSIYRYGYGNKYSENILELSSNFNGEFINRPIERYSLFMISYIRNNLGWIIRSFMINGVLFSYQSPMNGNASYTTSNKTTFNHGEL